jgi:hypothetical protein
VADAAQALLEGAQTVNDTLAELFFDTTTITLMKAADAYDDFDEILVVSSHWWAEESNFGKNILVNIADNSQALIDAMTQATHFLIGTVVYEIDRRNTAPPQGSEVEWRIAGDRYTKRSRFQAIY